MAKVQGDKEELITLVAGKSKREAERLVAELMPSRRSKKERITVKRVSSERCSPNLFDIELPPPVAVTKFSLSFEADAEFMDLYEKAKAFSGAHTLLEVMRKTLAHYVKTKSPVARQNHRKEKLRSNKTIHLRPAGYGGQAATMTVTRHVPIKIRDEVYVREGGQCCFKSKNGSRCAETNNL